MLLIIPAVHAQDVIYYNNGSTDTVQVVDMDGTEVRFRKWNNLDGPRYLVPINDISVIIHEDGEHVVVGSNRNVDDSLNARVSFPNNLVTFDVLDAAYGQVSLSYERIFFKGTMGIEALGAFTPESSRYRAQWYNDAFAGSRWGTGLNINIYPVKQRWLTYAIGPSFEIGDRWDYGYPYLYDPYYTVIPEYEVTRYYQFVVRNVITAHAIRNFAARMAVGVGVRDTARRDPFGLVTVDLQLVGRF